MNINTQPTKGRWVYSYQFSKHFFIDEQGRIIDPDVAKITKPLTLQTPVQNAAPAPVQRNVGPAPVQRIVAPAPVQRNVAPVPVQRNVAAPVPRPVAPALVQRNVVVVPAVTRPVVRAPPVQRRVAPAPVQRRVAPAPTPARNNLAYVNRATRSASVSSSGSSRSNSSRRSNASTRRPKAKSTRFQKVWLNRQAVLRRGPSLTTRVKKNLDKDTQITVDTSVIVNIFVRDNLRKRIKVISPITGWVTVETEKGRLYRKCQASLESNI